MSEYKPRPLSELIDPGWVGWMQVGLSAAFVGACLVVAWPKA